MRKLLLTLWICGTAVCFGQWYFEAGPWFRGDMDLTVEGGSRAAQDGARAARPGTRGDTAEVEGTGVADDGTAQVLREFDDGYVGPSGWEWAADLGFTQYFGYESAGQYNATENTLTFAQTASAEETVRRTETRVTSGPAGWGGSSDLDGEGVQLTMGYSLLLRRLFDVSFQLQAGWLEGLDASFRDRQTWSQQVEWITHESRAEVSQQSGYVYDTLGNPFFPPAPYEMTDPSGVGPMIGDRPIEIREGEESVETSDRVVSRRRATAVSRVDLETEGDLLVLTFGPRLRFRPLERLAILVQGGATVNLLDVEMERTEIFAWEDGRVIQSWTDKVDEQEWLWGATISAGLQFDLAENLYLTTAGGYDWVEQASFSAGPDRVHYDLDGWRAEAALGWRFGGR